MFVFLERSSLLGRCRPVGRSGEPGSFLTRILGPPAPRDLCIVKQDRVSKTEANKIESQKKKTKFAYALGGEGLCVLAVAPGPLGLRLSDRNGCAGAFGVADTVYGGGGAAAVFGAAGDIVVGRGRSEL